MMKKSLLISLLLSGSHAAVAMEDSGLVSPESSSITNINFLTPDDVFQKADMAPAEVQEWVMQRADLFKSMQLPPLKSRQEFLDHIESVKKNVAAADLKSLSDGNYIFDINNAWVVRHAGLSSTLLSKISSLGHDPYSSVIREMNDNQKLQLKASVIESATQSDTSIHQHTSMVAYWLRLKQLQGAVKTVKTFPVHYAGDVTKFHDGTYLVAQEKLDGRCVMLSSLSNEKITGILESNNVLADLAQAVAIGGTWSLHRENLFYNEVDGCLYVVDLEKPNNEGFGANAKWKTAVFGNGKESDDAWKWNHNMQEGFNIVQNDIIAPLNNQKLTDEWQRLRLKYTKN